MEDGGKHRESIYKCWGQVGVHCTWMAFQWYRGQLSVFIINFWRSRRDQESSSQVLKLAASNNFPRPLCTRLSVLDEKQPTVNCFASLFLMDLYTAKHAFANALATGSATQSSMALANTSIRSGSDLALYAKTCTQCS